MRSLCLALAVLLLAIQYPLWFGKGGWLRVWEMEREVAAQREVNAGLRLRNTAMDAEVRDLQSGTDAIEERARLELGLIREGELFVRIVDPTSMPPEAVRLPPPEFHSETPPAAAAPGSGAAGRVAPPR